MSATPQLESASLEAKRRLVTQLLQAKLARPRYFPLSYAQQRLWFLDQLMPGSTAYNIPVAVRLQGELSVEAVGKSLQEIVRRHEVLRTRFPMRDGEAVQEILPAWEAELQVVDLSGVGEKEREEALAGSIREEAGRGFDLAQGPLLRVKLVRLSEQEHVLVVSMHHIVSDGLDQMCFPKANPAVQK